MPEKPNPSARESQVERSLTRAMEEYNVPGVSIAVLDQYAVLWTRGYGVLQAGESVPVREDSLFQACSISKAVTAVAVLCLVQGGTLELDADVNRYLTTWKIPDNDGWQPVVKIRQLLSHTAGINVPWFYGYHREQDVPSLEQILNGEKPANTPGIRVTALPGTRFRYSGGGYCVLQQLLCDVRKQTFPELMRDLVLDPAGMTHSTYEQPLPEKRWSHASRGHRANGKPLPGGWHTMPEQAAAGLWTTAADLGRLSLNLQHALAGQTDRILSPEMARTMLSPEAQRASNVFMGLGMWLEGQGTNARFGHPGDNEGFNSRWVALREDGMGAVILTNSDNGGELIADVLQTIEQAYGWPEVKDLPAPESSGMPSTMDFAGTYRFRSGIVCTVSQVKDKLYLQIAEQPPVPLTAITETVYILQSLEGEVLFLRDQKGTVRGLQLQQDGSTLEAEKVG